MPKNKYNVENSEWKHWNRKKWETYFRDYRGLESFPAFSGTLLFRAQKAAEFFSEKEIPDFSGAELVAIANLDRINQKDSLGLLAMTYGAIAEHYRERGYASDMRFLQIPAIHLLRIETGNYNGNLHLCKGYEINQDGKLLVRVREPVYNIFISCNDWQEGLRLPLPHEYSPDVAKLFGFYWGVGCLTKVGTKGQLLLSGREFIREILRGEVKELAKKVHGINFQEEDQKDNQVTIIEGKQADLNGYCLQKESAALSSWLINEHRFPSPSKRSRKENERLTRVPKDHLPNLPWTKETIDNFVLGLIKVRGNDGHYELESWRNMDRISINGKGGYGKSLSGLLEVAEHNHSIQYRNNRRWVIHLNKGETLYFRGLIKG